MNEIFIAIYDRLVSQLSVPVLENVPQDYDNYPYVVVESLADGENDTDTENAFNSTITIHVWSGYSGNKEINDIQKQIYDALHQYDIPDTANYAVCGGIRQTIKTVVKQPDGLTRQGVQRYQLFYEPLPI